MFQVVTPHVISDELTFDITFYPGKGGIKLVNQTLYATEGRLQQVWKHCKVEVMFDIFR